MPSVKRCTSGLANNLFLYLGVDFGLSGLGGYEDLAAELAVDLDDELELVGLDCVFADFGPRCVAQGADAFDEAELLPERRRDVRGDRVERAQQDRGTFAESRQIGGGVSPLKPSIVLNIFMQAETTVLYCMRLKSYSAWRSVVWTSRRRVLASCGSIWPSRAPALAMRFFFANAQFQMRRRKR